MLQKSPYCITNIMFAGKFRRLHNGVYSELYAVQILHLS